MSAASVNRNRTILAFAVGWILFWLLMIAVAIQDYRRSGGSALWEPVLWEGSSALVITAIGAAYRRWSRTTDRLLHAPLRWFLAQLRWLPFICIGFVVTVYAVRHGVYALFGMEYRHDTWGAVFVYESVKLSLFFGIFMAVLFGILSYRELAAEKERAQRSSALLRQAQLQSLTQQIQPHFLFNALNTISSLMHSDVQRADTMLARLSDVLRATLDLSERTETDVRGELELLRAYAQLMVERFADRVAIEWHVDDSALDCRIPVMILQPLLENIFKHTVEKRSKPVRIRIFARREEGQVVLTIDDDAGMLAPAETAGIGTRNLRERLAAVHGDRGIFQLTQLEPAGVRAEIRLPCVC
jgi:two-component system, LytTR family, sensor kinase